MLKEIALSLGFILSTNTTTTVDLTSQLKTYTPIDQSIHDFCRKNRMCIGNEGKGWLESARIVSSDQSDIYTLELSARFHSRHIIISDRVLYSDIAHIDFSGLVNAKTCSVLNLEIDSNNDALSVLATVFEDQAEQSLKEFFPGCA